VPLLTLFADAARDYSSTRQLRSATYCQAWARELQTALDSLKDGDVDLLNRFYQDLRDHFAHVDDENSRLGEDDDQVDSEIWEARNFLPQLERFRIPAQSESGREVRPQPLGDRR
jgi:hypothetical protein